MSKVSGQPDDSQPAKKGGSPYRPSDRFWPYVEVPEEPSDEELALLNPELRSIVLGTPSELPFSVTVVFSRFDGPDYERAVELARDSSEYHVSETGVLTQHRARFFPGEVLKLKALFELVGPLDSCEVLVDDRRIPYARELWLPLFWFLIHR